jgi:hypothetical protein
MKSRYLYYWGHHPDRMVVGFTTTVDSRYLKFDGTMGKISQP